MLRIVVLDAHTLDPGDLGWDELRALGSCQIHPRTAPEDLLQRARGAPVLFTNKTRLERETLEQLPDLRYIGVLATGHDVVDVVAARERGVVVCNVPGYGAASVAQHTLALLLELTNHVGLHARLVAEGEWRRRGEFSFFAEPMLELDQRTLGIVGPGSIGRRVGALGRTLGMRVVASGRTRQAAGPGHDFAMLPLEELLRGSDVVSLHCPLTEQTRGLLNAERLGWLQPSALLINTARGALVEPVALRQALDQGRLAGAALDVLDSEPPGPDHPLVGAPRCLVTPHHGWATHAARARLMASAVANLRAFLEGSPRHVVG